jgi:hypothetical protein
MFDLYAPWIINTNYYLQEKVNELEHFLQYQGFNKWAW